MSDPLFLGIETSLAQGSVALFQGNKPLFGANFTTNSRASNALWPPLKEAINFYRTLETPLSAVIVGLGPASYNGTRVGIAAAQGIALQAGCPTIGLPSYEGIEDSNEPYLAIGDARRGQYSVFAGPGPVSAEEHRFVSASELTTLIEEAFAAGKRVVTFEETSRFPLPEHLINSLQSVSSQADQLIRSFAKKPLEQQITCQAQPPQPLYLRPPHITASKKPSPLSR